MNAGPNAPKTPDDEFSSIDVFEEDEDYIDDVFDDDDDDDFDDLEDEDFDDFDFDEFEDALEGLDLIDDAQAQGKVE